MRVVHVINSLMIGGAEVLLANSLSAGGLQEKIDNKLIYFNGSKLLSKIDKRVETVCLDYSGLSKLPSTLKRLKKEIVDFKADIVHTHLSPVSFYVDAILPKKIKQVHTLHTLYSHDFETRKVIKFLEKNLYLKKKDTHLIFLTEEIEKDFKKHVSFKGRSYILPNFISDEFFTPFVPKTKSNNVFKVIAVGALKDLKNHQYLIDVFKHLKNKNISLDIYGDGVNRAIYQQQIDEEALPIQLRGYSGDLHSILPEYDLFIMPSIFEGYPLSVLEAMAAGVPAFLADIESLKNIGRDNANYFSLTDAKATAEKLIALQNNEAELEACRKKARNYAEKIGRRDAYITGLLSIYHDILKHPN